MSERTDACLTLGCDAPQRAGEAERLTDDACRKEPTSGESTAPAIGLADLLLPFAPRAVSVLASLMQDEGQKPELRVKVAESILDRVLGKSGGTLTGEGNGVIVRFEGELEEWSR